MLQIHLDKEIMPVDFFSYTEVGTGLSSSGKPCLVDKQLPIYVGEFEGGAADLDVLVLCSDLQGLVQEKETWDLLGTVLPSFLQLWLAVELDLEETAQIGALLCGDFYTNLDKRGASGDIRVVWKAFGAAFDWVAGVAGNHDRFGTIEEEAAFKSTKNIHLLEAESVELAGLNIGGLSGIIGRADKPQRLEEATYLKHLKKLLRQDLDLLLLHESPDYPPLNLQGKASIREVIEQSPAARIASGHCHWTQLAVVLEGGTQVLNLDAKVLVLKRRQG